MIYPQRISAEWLIGGLQSTYVRETPPSGLEFKDLLLEPGEDPIPQIGRYLASPRSGLAMQSALQEALADTTLTRFEPQFANAVMLGLIRLLDYFGSPQANRTLLANIRRGAFRNATAELLERVANVGARQAPKLRTEFERSMRDMDDGDMWTTEFVTPFLTAELEEKTEQWLDVALERIDDLEALATRGLNLLAIALGRLCDSGLCEAVLDGFASGYPHHVRVLKVLFGNAMPRAELVLSDEGTQYDQLDRTYKGLLIFDETRITFVVSQLLHRRPREISTEDTLIEADARRSGAIEDWEYCLRERAVYVDEEREVA
jgi:hypothetical protein